MSKYLEHLRKCQENPKSIHAISHVGKMIDRIEILEQKLWEKYHQEACDHGATIEKAVDYANERINDL